MKDACLANVNLKNAKCKYAIFNYADLSEADFIGANLSNANMKGTNLTNANMMGADLSNVQFDDVTVEGAVSSAVLLDITTDVPLKKTTLEGAILTRLFSSIENIETLIDQRKKIACKDNQIASFIAQQYSNKVISDMFTEVDKQYNCENLLLGFREYITDTCNEISPYIENIKCHP